MSVFKEIKLALVQHWKPQFYIFYVPVDPHRNKTNKILYINHYSVFLLFKSVSVTTVTRNTKQINLVLKQLNALEWNFFATSHVKGAINGIGETFKRIAHNLVKSGRMIKYADDFYTNVLHKDTAIKCKYVTKKQIDKHHEEVGKVTCNCNKIARC